MENTYKLIGSEKQITWASSILDDIMETLNRNIEVNKERGQAKEVKAFEITKNKVVKIIEQRKEAAFYIDNRDKFNQFTVIKSAEGLRNKI